ncbi:MAG: hypothetical protein K2Q09_08545 [Phycisphaerales bacterium]|nr:hypothetical protein [Phycisphaerales bacterium]
MPLIQRIKNAIRRALLTAAAAMLALGGACQATVSDTLVLGDGPHTAAGGWGAANGEALFDSPGASQIAALVGRENLPEYARLDDRMSIDNSQPLLATGEWPQPAAPDATRVYYLYLPLYTSSSSQLVPLFGPQRAYRPGRPSYYP